MVSCQLRFSRLTRKRRRLGRGEGRRRGVGGQHSACIAQYSIKYSFICLPMLAIILLATNFAQNPFINDMSCKYGLQNDSNIYFGHILQLERQQI